MTVTSRPRSSRARWLVVVPMSTSSTSPSRTSPAATEATRCLASWWSTATTSKGGSEVPSGARAAVHPLQHSLRLEVGQVPPHGRSAHPELARERRDLGGSRGAQPLQDVVVATPGEHAHKVAGRNAQK